MGLGLEVLGVLILVVIIQNDTAGWVVALPLTLYGLGLGLASAQLTGTVLRDIPVDVSGQGSATQSTVRQIGTALGTAFAGAALSVSLAFTLPAALDDTRISGDTAEQIADATRESAGSAITQLSAQGDKGPLGEDTSTAVDALTTGFANATRWTLGVAMVFLLLGLLGAIRVRVVANRADNAHQ